MPKEIEGTCKECDLECPCVPMSDGRSAWNHQLTQVLEWRPQTQWNVLFARHHFSWTLKERDLEGTCYAAVWWVLDKKPSTNGSVGMKAADITKSIICQTAFGRCCGLLSHWSAIKGKIFTGLRKPEIPNSMPTEIEGTYKGRDLERMCDDNV